MDLTVKAGNVFMIVLKQEEILEHAAILADVVSDLVAREIMSSSVIMIQLIQNATKEAITVRLHS
jgi:hypothetical protein